MIQKDLLLSELQKQVRETDNEQVKLALGAVIAEVLSGKFNIRVW